MTDNQIYFSSLTFVNLLVVRRFQILLSRVVLKFQECKVYWKLAATDALDFADKDQAYGEINNNIALRREIEKNLWGKLWVNIHA